MCRHVIVAPSCVMTATALNSTLSARFCGSSVDGMDKAQQGLAAAAKGHDVALSRSFAKADLDLVDELEAYFAKAAKK